MNSRNPIRPAHNWNYFNDSHRRPTGRWVTMADYVCSRDVVKDDEFWQRLNKYVYYVTNRPQRFHCIPPWSHIYGGGVLHECHVRAGLISLAVGTFPVDYSFLYEHCFGFSSDSASSSGGSIFSEEQNQEEETAGPSTILSSDSEDD